MSSTEENKEKKYEIERFDFAVFVNDFIVCKRNFKINNFIEHSMETLDFKEFVDGAIIGLLDWEFTPQEVVDENGETHHVFNPSTKGRANKYVNGLINNDLKGKSRTYTWYYYDPRYEDNGEFDQPLLEPWECTFKFVIYDNGREVFSRIWDGRYYPRYIRNMVDLSNKIVKFTNKQGHTFTFDKESYFSQNEGRLSYEMEILKKLIYNRPNLLYQIAKSISDKCSTFNPDFRSYDKRQTVEKYGDKKYNFNIEDLRKKEENAWAKKLNEKTKAYFKNLY